MGRSRKPLTRYSGPRVRIPVSPLIMRYWAEKGTFLANRKSRTLTCRNLIYGIKGSRETVKPNEDMGVFMYNRTFLLLLFFLLIRTGYAQYDFPEKVVKYIDFLSSYTDAERFQTDMGAISQDSLKTIAKMMYEQIV
jgi:hypothetical protein